MRALGFGIAAIVILGGSALLDQESGFGVWLRLGEDLSRSEARVARLERQNEVMRREIELLAAEPAAIDRAIREELDLALPGEVIVRFKGSGMPAGSDEEGLSLQDLFSEDRSDRETR